MPSVFVSVLMKDMYLGEIKYGTCAAKGSWSHRTMNHDFNFRGINSAHQNYFLELKLFVRVCLPGQCTPPPFTLTRYMPPTHLARQLNSQANRTEKETGELAGRAAWSFAKPGLSIQHTSIRIQDLSRRASCASKFVCRCHLSRPPSQAGPKPVGQPPLPPRSRPSPDNNVSFDIKSEHLCYRVPGIN
jgi:hypothetical protein